MCADLEVDIKETPDRNWEGLQLDFWPNQWVNACFKHSLRSARVDKWKPRGPPGSRLPEAQRQVCPLGGSVVVAEWSNWASIKGPWGL